jgi:hypothetical protein
MLHPDSDAPLNMAPAPSSASPITWTITDTVYSLSLSVHKSLPVGPKWAYMPEIV